MPKSCDSLTGLIVARDGLFANPRKAWPTHPFGGPLLARRSVAAPGRAGAAESAQEAASSQREQRPRPKGQE